MIKGAMPPGSDKMEKTGRLSFMNSSVEVLLLCWLCRSWCFRQDIVMRLRVGFLPESWSGHPQIPKMHSNSSQKSKGVHVWLFGDCLVGQKSAPTKSHIEAWSGAAWDSSLRTQLLLTTSQCCMRPRGRLEYIETGKGWTGSSFVILQRSPHSYRAHFSGVTTEGGVPTAE